MNECKTLQWSEVYNLGHHQVDIEHQKLFELANKVNKSDSNSEKLLESIKELIEYTKYHFSNEEKFMTAINFKYLDEHKLLHKEIVQKLNALLKEFNQYTIEEFSQKILLFI